MFGVFRTSLAAEVLIGHLYFAPISSFAVFSFFVLSGFLMMLIMTERYGFTSYGRVRFLANRALRIFPAYWFAILLTLILTTVMGSEVVSTFQGEMTTPKTAIQWIFNLTCLFPRVLVERWGGPRLSPAAWALTVELLFYALICAGISKSIVRTVVWLLASAVYTGWALVHPSQQTLYFSMFAGSFPFALGAFFFHCKDSIARRIVLLGCPYLQVTALVCVRWAGLLSIAAIVSGSQPAGTPLGAAANLLNSVLTGVIVVGLFGLPAPPFARRADRAIGDYSYPVYLLQWQSGAIASWLIFRSPQPSKNDPLVFCVAVAVVIAISLFWLTFLEVSVQRLRRRFSRRQPGSEHPRVAD